MLSILLLSLALADRPDRVIADFEAPTYGQWVVTGEAFGPGPAKGALAGQMAVGGYEGERLVNSFFKGDDSEGTLTSPEFPIDRKYVRFLIGGGRYPGELGMELVVDGKAVRTASGYNSETLRAASWDVSEFEGKTGKRSLRDRLHFAAQPGERSPLQRAEHFGVAVFDRSLRAGWGMRNSGLRISYAGCRIRHSAPGPRNAQPGPRPRGEKLRRKELAFENALL